jgi:chromosome segregation ATPase
VITSDITLHQLANVLHGRSVLISNNADDKEIQHHLWAASVNIASLESNPALEDRVSRLAEIIEQTALLRLNRPITSRSASQERKRNEQSHHLHQQQSTHWSQQRRRAHQSIDALRQELLQLHNDLEAAKDDANNTRQALRAQHNRLNELETEIARRDQGPARLQRSIDWHSVAAQLERDLLKVLRWLRRRLGRG